MKKILTYTIITIAVLGLCGIVIVNAQAKGNNGFHSSIIQKLTERFGLNVEEVQKVFEEAREERLEEMRTRFEERAGDKMPKFSPCISELTDEQKEALLVKREELREKFEALKDLSLEERQAKMKEIREEIEAWAKEQGVDLICMGRCFKFGFRGPKSFNRGSRW